MTQTPGTPTIEFDALAKVHIAAGQIIKVEGFPRARTPSYKVLVDFGPEIGHRWSSVQAGKEYTVDELLGRLVVGVVNLAPKNIAGFMSEVLLLGVPAEDDSLSLLVPSRGARLGGRVY